MAGALLGGSFAVAVYGARTLVHHAVAVARDRERDQQMLVAAQLGQALAPAHDAINAVETDLRDLLDAYPLREPCRIASCEALDRLERIAALLEGGRAARETLADEDGFIPLLGIHAARLASSRRSSRLIRRYGSRAALPRAIPSDLRGAARQVGLVLDELRLLHTTEIERSVLLFTLTSRAVLVSFAPLLGSWTGIRPPLAGGSAAANLAWAAAAVVSVGTALAGPRIVDLAMQDGPAGRGVRTKLLALEVPIALVVIPLVPAWTVVVFASGWTNWWQRQSPRHAFDWRKLCVFVGAVIALQAGGLAHEHVEIGRATGEILIGLLALSLTGGSYGAMLPLSIGTGLDVLVGDGRRSLRAVMKARHELLGSARQLIVTAAEIEASAPDSQVAQRAAATARQAARQLDHAADRAGRRGLVSSHVLVELAAEAIARSYLPRRGSIEFNEHGSPASIGDHARPPYATEPIFDPPSLLAARVSRQRDAQALRSIIERCLNEAHIHGIKGVRVLVQVKDDRLAIRIGNRPRPGTRGISGEGARELDRLARRLPSGSIERGFKPPATVRMPPGSDWWVAEFRCAAGVLDRTLEYSAPT